MTAAVTDRPMWAMSVDDRADRALAEAPTMPDEYEWQRIGRARDVQARMAAIILAQTAADPSGPGWMADLGSAIRLAQTAVVLDVREHEAIEAHRAAAAAVTL